MSDSLVPDIVKSASEAVQQNLPETAKQTDGALSTVVGLFNNVVLYPVKKANLSFKYKLEAFENDLKEKIKNIPEENLQIPPTMIAGPLLEALRYTYDEEELREMYENLLASAMDERKIMAVHPSYVDAIRQMSPLDAKVLKRIVNCWPLPCATVQADLRDGTEFPEYYVSELSDLSNPFNISVSISNLDRLGLIDNLEIQLDGKDYRVILNDPFFQKIEESHTSSQNRVKILRRTITLNDYDVGVKTSL